MIVITFGLMDFSQQLIQWYHQNKRDLPWRHTKDPYIIWLSEIILQQTRVEQGLPYFNRFVENYPTVADFAHASEDEILKLWQGLGYYSRGRNMLKTARLIQTEHNGAFPSAYANLIKLKGIGPYTAAAISSFAGDEPYAVVDGNVYRVLARYFGIDTPINSTDGKRLFQQIANEVLNNQLPGIHNQAVMELGALVCKPQKPDCNTCPLQPGCYAYKNNRIAQLPVKLKKSKYRVRYFNYILVHHHHQILLNKRGENDIWANMYDLPLIETPDEVTLPELVKLPEFQNHFNCTPENITDMGTIKHILTHQRLYVRLIAIGNEPHKLKPQWFYTSINNIEKYPVPKIITLLVKNIFNL